MQTLSDAALALLLLHVEHGELPVNDSNRELHRELARHRTDGCRPHVLRWPGAVLPVYTQGLGFRLHLKSARDRMGGW